MRTNIRRSTGREVTKCSFQIDVKDIDLVEKISKRRMVEVDPKSRTVFLMS